MPLSFTEYDTKKRETQRERGKRKERRERKSPRDRSAVRDPNVIFVQNFLLQQGRDIGSRTGRPDGDWGPASNRALAELINDYNANPNKYKGQTASTLKELAEQGRFVSRNPEVTENNIGRIAAIIRAGGEIPGEDIAAGRKPIRDVPVKVTLGGFGDFPSQSANAIFPIFAVMLDPSLRSIQTAITNRLILPYLQQVGKGRPSSWAEIDKNLMAQATAGTLQSIEEYVRGVEGFEDNQRLQQALDEVRARFMSLTQQYNQMAEAPAGTEKKRNVRDMLLKEMPRIFMQVDHMPQLKQQMLDRAAWIMERRGAVDEEGNIRSMQLYRGTLGRVRRELMNWLEHFAQQANIQPKQTQQPQMPKTQQSSPGFQERMKALQKYPTEQSGYANIQELAKGIKPPQPSL